VADRCCDRRGRAEESPRPAYVEERLVDGDPFDERREVAKDLDHSVAEALVLAEVAPDEEQLRTRLLRLPTGHTGVHTEGARFIRRREHDAAAYGDRLVAQRRIEQLLDRRIERI
jgi:hypothetical protein